VALIDRRDSLPSSNAVRAHSIVPELSRSRMRARTYLRDRSCETDRRVGL